MKTIETDKDGNVQVRNGDFVVIDGKESMMQECWHRAYMFMGDDIFNKDRGIPLANTLRGNFQTEDILTSQMEAQIEDNEEITEATVEMQKSGDEIKFNVSVESDYGSVKI